MIAEHGEIYLKDFVLLRMLGLFGDAQRRFLRLRLKQYDIWTGSKNKCTL